MRVITFFLVLICSFSVQAGVVVDHLATPAKYDNAYGYPETSYGQTFVSDGQSIVGVDIYVNDPTRPDDPCCNELIGPAELRLYEVSDLNNPILLGTSTVAANGEVLSGLVPLNFDNPIQTSTGTSYFFMIFAADSYGLGLRTEDNTSTYPDGMQASYSAASDSVILHPDERDLSFRVRGIKAPAAPALRTGQSTCYDISGTFIPCAGTGQDGEYQKGIVDNVSRYKDNSDGTITDNKTGLVWVQQVLCAFPLNWQQALDHANNLADGQCGLTDGSEPGDWRLPNYRELQSLNWQYNVGANDIGLPISNPFNFINKGFIWSSTSQFSTPQNAECLITNGGTSPSLKTRTDIAGAWAVRDAPQKLPPGC